MDILHAKALIKKPAKYDNKDASFEINKATCTSEAFKQHF
jgi:hypothetical protein